MIKPETLWALFKKCEDSKWIGDVCRALGGQDVALDFGQRQMFNTIQQDSGWLDERIEMNRERVRRNVAAYRERKKKESITGDVMITGKCNRDVIPSYLPTILPTKPTGCNVCEVPHTPRTNKSRPTLEEVLKVGVDDLEIPETFIRWWFSEEEKIKWVQASGKPVTRSNWTYVLQAWYRKEVDKQESSAGTSQGSGQPEGVVLKQKGYDPTRFDR